MKVILSLNKPIIENAMVEVDEAVHIELCGKSEEIIKIIDWLNKKFDVH
jgi:hypothetical protein